MAGLDLTARFPVCGLGIPFELNELDFVWLAVYFDTNLRPIHAGIQKGSKFSRWYEYGGVSIGGFPRSIKTVRRDHIGTDVGVPDAKGYVLPDIRGPEIEYLDYEIEKEVEWLSPKGFLYDPRGQVANNAMDVFKKAMASELTYFVGDPIQVKQWASYTLLGYCTSVAPDAQYPYPNVPLSREIGGKTISWYYRQACTDHLMLQEANAAGVRSVQLVPSFPPYMEACPHPQVFVDVGADGKQWGISVKPSNGVEGTLPAAVVNHADYEGQEVSHGVNKPWLSTANVKVRVPLPGENAQVTKQAAGPIGSSKARIAYQLYGGPRNFTGTEVRPKHSDTHAYLDVAFSEFSSANFWATAEGMLDSPMIKINYKDDGSGTNTKKFYYVTTGGKEIPLS
jgi:hypothetical protein